MQLFIQKSNNANVDIGKQINNFWQPQLISLILVTLVLVIFSIVIYRKAIKQPKDKAPEGILLVTEIYVKGVEDMVETSGEGKLSKAGPYIFTLLTFLMFGNIIGIFGFEAPVTSYAVPFTLGLITWLGIYVIGILYNKWSFFKKYRNPLEWVGQFTPLISISMRIFGNIIAGSTIMYLIYYFTGWIWGHIPFIGALNILGAFLSPAFHVYFDIFSGLVQAYVFVVLTLAFWSTELPSEKAEPKVESGTYSEKKSRRFSSVKRKVALKK